MELHYLNKSRAGELSNTASSHARALDEHQSLARPRSALDEHQSLVRSLRAEKRDLEAKYDESRRAILALRAETSKLLSENKALALRASENKALALRASENKARGLLESATKEHLLGERCASTLLSENATLRDKCERLKEKRATCISEHAALRERHESLQSENLALRDKCVSLLAENKALVSSAGGSGLQGKCVSLLTENKALRSSAGGLKDRCVSLLAENKALRSSAGGADDRSASLLTENKTLRQEHKELLSKCSSYQAEREADTHRIQTLVDAMGGVHTLLDTLAEAGVAQPKDLSESQRFIRKIVTDVTQE